MRALYDELERSADPLLLLSLRGVCDRIESRDPDVEIIVRFVLWRTRIGDLPPDVAAAALRLVESRRWPRAGEVIEAGLL